MYVCMYVCMHASANVFSFVCYERLCTRISSVYVCVEKLLRKRMLCVIDVRWQEHDHTVSPLEQVMPGHVRSGNITLPIVRTRTPLNHESAMDTSSPCLLSKGAPLYRAGGRQRHGDHSWPLLTAACHHPTKQRWSQTHSGGTADNIDGNNSAWNIQHIPIQYSVQ